MSRGGAMILAGLLGVAAAAAGFLLARQHHREAVSILPVGRAGVTMPRAADVVGSPRPAFSLPDLDGNEHHISEWDGSVVVINFWATWCPPCRKEIPEFMDLQRQYEERGVRFLGIALEGPENVKEFAGELGINYQLLAGELGVIGIAEAYGDQAGALPYTVILGRDGRIAFAHVGPVPRDRAEAVIRSLL